MRSSLRFAVVYIATAVVVLMYAPAPAQAGPFQDIWRIVNNADAANEAVIDEFVTAATGAIVSGSIEDLNTARDRAHARLDGIWYTAAAALDAIADLHPEYEDDVDVAMGALNEDHNEAHAEVTAYYNIVYDAITGGSTTTTSSTSTTSTTTTSTTTTTTTRPPSSSTTTTSRPPSSSSTTTTTTTTVPSTSSTTTPPDTTTTTTIADTTTTTAPSSAIPPGTDPPPGADPRPSTDPTPGDGGTVIDDPSVILSAPAVLDSSTRADESAEERQGARSRGVVSEMITTGFSQVFPPAIAQFTAAPFVVVEMLVMTLFESVRTMIVPFMAISLVMLLFLWSERRRYPESLPT